MTKLKNIIIKFHLAMAMVIFIMMSTMATAPEGTGIALYMCWLLLYVGLQCLITVTAITFLCKYISKKVH